MLKVLGVLFMILLTFGGGFYLGSNRLGEISNSLIGFKKEMGKKTSVLEKEINKLRLRMTLVEIRNHLNNSMEEHRKRNFGNAQGEIKEAQTKLEKSIQLADETLKVNLIKISNQLSTLETKAAMADSRVIAKIDKMREKVSQLIDE
ncbi:MAG TPA: hypothetical protein VGB26_02035 [Nitrospiria bacterium]